MTTDMRKTMGSWRRLIALLLVWAFATVLHAFNQALPADVRQTVVIEAAERMATLSRLMADRYMQLHPSVRIEVIEGRAAGTVVPLTEGSAQIVALDRFASKTEVDMCRNRRHAELVGIPVAVDAVAVFVNPANPIAQITLEQLREVFTGKMFRWSQLGAASDELIQRALAEQRTGVPDVFEQTALGGRAIAGRSKPFKTSREVASFVAGSELAMGLGGVGQAIGVVVLPIARDASSNPAAPDARSVQSFEYPLSHYAYWYFAGQPEGVLRDLMKFAVGTEGQAVVRKANLGFAPLPGFPIPDEEALPAESP